MLMKDWQLDNLSRVSFSHMMTQSCAKKWSFSANNGEWLRIRTRAEAVLTAEMARSICRFCGQTDEISKLVEVCRPLPALLRNPTHSPSLVTRWMSQKE